VLRITIHHNPSSQTFQLEGTLAGPWVRELAECWQRTLADQGVSDCRSGAGPPGRQAKVMTFT
jgi:hypothetical protein